jgi:predicted PurR-regulated permease PerM
MGRRIDPNDLQRGATLNANDQPATLQESPALKFRRAFLLLLVAGISVLFLFMIRPFLLAVFLAAILAGLTHSVYEWLLTRFGGRANLAAIMTIAAVLLGVAVPLVAFLAVVASQAIQVGQGAEEWLRSQQGRIQELQAWVGRYPLIQRWLPPSEQLMGRARELAERTGGVLFGTLAAATRSTLNFFLQLFVLLYATFFFLVGGRALLRRIVGYLPLSPTEEDRLLERFVSVARATLKGSLLIAIVQGGLGGLGFWVAGVPAPAFWGTVMVVLSLIPAVGAALVWIPAVIYLLLQGSVLAGLGLLAWSALVVGTVDNFLRPRLVGRDARMPDLLILLSTLGGIFLFGAVGFVVGPIIAALFVTVWHIYGEAFSEWLPTRGEPAVGAEGPTGTRTAHHGGQTPSDAPNDPSDDPAAEV